jgi:hypothetical protein
MADDRRSPSRTTTDAPRGAAGTVDTSPKPGPGADKHGDEPGFHGHAPYPSAEDLETRLAAARGATAYPSQYDQPLPYPDPAQQ